MKEEKIPIKFFTFEFIVRTALILFATTLFDPSTYTLAQTYSPTHDQALTGAATKREKDRSRKILINFGRDQATTRTPFSDWTQVLRHTTYTEYVDPSGNPEHWGLTCVAGIPSGEYAYFGIEGITAHHFSRGQRIVATFYNRSSSARSFRGRVSFVDRDSPDSSQTDKPWYTLYNQSIAYSVPGLSLVEYEFYITDASMVHHLNSPPAQGDRTLVNISLFDNSTDFVLTRVELADDADVTPPSVPSDMQIELTKTTEGCGQNVVKLSWTPSIDPGDNADGINKYLIYRNGQLYEELPQAVIDARGEDPWFIDLNVVPDTLYTYTVTVLDNAPFGMYAHQSHPNTRKGNESDHCQPLAIQTPSWSSATLINPYVDLEYQGVFRLPDDPGVGEDWDYAHRGLAYYPTGNPGYDPATELSGSLYGIGHNHRCHISEISIPKSVITPDINAAPRAKTLKPFVDIWPPVYNGSQTPPGNGGMTMGLTYHPAANGVPEYLYYSLSMWYNPDPSAPPMGVFSLDLTSAYGAWHVADLPPNNVFPGLVTHIAFKLSDAWAQTYTAGRTLVIGSVYISGSGTPARGPSLYATAPWESGALPAHEGFCSASELLKYEGGYSYDKMLLNFSGGESGDGGAWISSGSLAGIAVQITRSVGETWYGDGGGQQTCSYDIPQMSAVGSKGYNYTSRSSRIIFYNPDDLAAVVLGNKEPWEPQPFVEYDLKPFTLEPEGMSSDGALAFDDTNGYLFFIEENGDPGYTYGYGLIHVWKVW